MVAAGAGATMKAAKGKGLTVKVKDLMTHEVVTATPAMSLKQVATVLVDHAISGLPVCDPEGHVVGVVSETDILYKEQGTPRRGEHGPLSWLVDGTSYDEAAKAAAKTASEAMTAPPVVIGPQRTISDAAKLMIARGVNRLPVVEGDRLVGILTRGDLVRAFKRTDTEIAQELREDLIERTLWLPSTGIEIKVVGGEVTFAGEVETRSDAQLIERLATRVPGVVSVSSSLTWRYDDIRRKREPVAAGS